MTDYSRPQPDRPDATHTSDLAALREHPSLTSLHSQGWRLDDLPTRSVAWAFVGALLATLLAFGLLVGAFFVVMIGLGMLPLVAALCVGRARAALLLLRVGRLGLLIWLVVCTGFVHSSPTSPAGATPATSLSTSLSTSTKPLAMGQQWSYPWHGLP